VGATTLWAELIAVIVGAVVLAIPATIKIIGIVAHRLIDRFLPDPEDKHPLPPDKPTTDEHNKNS
jgi:hypothetical protein